MTDLIDLDLGTIKAWRGAAPKATIGFDMSATHVPVLAAELIEALHPKAGETVVDCTFGAGGHAELLADRIGPRGTLIAIDRDPSARDHFERFAAAAACHARFINASFADALTQLGDEGVRADVVYADLGISSMQVDTWGRGFSYSYDAPLDMRMDTEQELDAREIVNSWDAPELTRMMRDYGEERYAPQITRAIVRERARKPLETTSELVDVITGAIPAAARFAGGHPAKRVFQAIRIAVNDELGQIDAGLPAAWELLRKDGRFAGISFHSLEDRRVKRFLAGQAQGCICPPGMPICGCGQTPSAELITRRAIVPTPGEIASNPRSSSARLRAARKIV